MLWLDGLFFSSLSSIAIYLDPGSGSFLIQLLIAGVAALGIALASQWGRIKRWFGKKKENTDELEDDDDEKEPKA
jgi:hypothetical protein